MLVGVLFAFIAIAEYSPIHRVPSYIARPRLRRLQALSPDRSPARRGARARCAHRSVVAGQFGEFTARVETVSDTPSVPAELAQMYALSEPAFVATASLPSELRTPSGQPLKIKAGMLADALVPIERRTVLEWLFEPILRGFNESAGRTRPATAKAPEAH
jgi:membrane fusion protein